MEDINVRNAGYSEALHRILSLHTEPIALKLVETGEELRYQAMHPYRDMGIHLAMCQAFSLVRREKKALFCDKESEWCWNPLVAFGLCESGEGTEAFDIISHYIAIKDNDAARRFFASFPRLPYGKYRGVIISPLCDCSYEPDVTLIYCDNNAQLRSALLAIKGVTGDIVTTQLDGIDSCAFSCVPAICSGEYRVTLPDVGEHERAMAGETEIILSVPLGRLGELTDSLADLHNSGRGHAHLRRNLTYDFTQPPFYKDLFRIWGVEE